MGLLSNSYRRLHSYLYEVVAGDADSVGYASISNAGSLGAFTGATVPAIPNGTYDLGVNVDGGADQLAIALLATDSWTGIAAKIQASLRTATGALETVVISEGVILITSATNGSTSTVVITEGTTGSANGGLLDAISAIGGGYMAQIDAPVDGLAATVGTQALTNTGALAAFTGATASGLGAATYDIDYKDDANPNAPLTVVVAGTEDWDAIAALIQASIRASTSALETCAVVGGEILFTSATSGAASACLVAAGTTGSGGGDLLAAITALSADYTATVAAAVDGVAATIGIAELSNTGSLAAFTGATVAAIATQTDWELDVDVDGVSYQLADIDIDITDDWDAVAAAIQVSLRTATSSTETVAISGGKVLITSVTSGAASAIEIKIGSAGTGSGDLLAVITGLGLTSPTYTSTIDTPVDGAEGAVIIDVGLNKDASGTALDFSFMFQVRDSSNKEKVGLKGSYSTTTGYLTIADDAAVAEIATGDLINVLGHFYSS